MQHRTACRSQADTTSTYACGMAQLLLRSLAALCCCVPRGIVWAYLNVEKHTKNDSLCGANLLPHHCCIHIRSMFVAGPNERIFVAIIFVVLRSSCARLSVRSLRQSLLLKNVYVPQTFFWPMCTNFWPTLYYLNCYR